MLHEASKRYLSAYKKEHGAVPKSAELKPLLATLQKEKSTLYEQYKIAKAERARRADEATHEFAENLRQGETTTGG